MATTLGYTSMMCAACQLRRFNTTSPAGGTSTTTSTSSATDLEAGPPPPLHSVADALGRRQRRTYSHTTPTGIDTCCRGSPVVHSLAVPTASSSQGLVPSYILT